MSDFFRRIRGADAPPSPESVLADLVEFHTARPGITEATLGTCTTRTGLTGYDVLVNHVPASARVVLDLGSGNGPLLERLLAKRPDLTRVVGVDLCRADLDLARRRLPDPRLELREERAQALGIASACVDAVLSHHAFYLMDPVEPVVSEVARVLRAGGVFAFVTSSPIGEQYEPFASMMTRFGELTAGDNPHFRGWGDRRVWSREGLSALFFDSNVGFVAPLSVEGFTLVIEEPLSALVARLMSFFYSVELQQPATKLELRRAWSELLQATCTPDGRAHLELPLACVSLRRAEVTSSDGA